MMRIYVTRLRAKTVGVRGSRNLGGGAETYVTRLREKESQG
jgi:hypothetical protein